MEVLVGFGRFGWVAIFLIGAGGLFTTGCGTPGAPQPPTLNLPDRVKDLRANRAGNEVLLNWTMPKKTTDKLLLKGDVLVIVCRRRLTAGPCDFVGSGLHAAPGTVGAFSETLPPALTSGAPQSLAYFVELKNRNSRSAGLSNPAVVLAGEAPPPVTGLVADVRKEGIVLRWTQSAAAPDQRAQTAIRLHRRLLTHTAAKPNSGLLAAQPEPLEQILLVEPASPPSEHPENSTQADSALDKQIQFGRTYEYRAQRLTRISLAGQTLELAGEVSPPVRVEALDVFPPAVPTDLAAVSTTIQAGPEVAIELNWQPVADTDLAGYAVYRIEGQAPWLRISSSQPLGAPAFRDTQVHPGHTYRYAVTSIDQGGHESNRSTETQETASTP